MDGGLGTRSSQCATAGSLYERHVLIIVTAYGVVVRPLSKSYILHFETQFRIRVGAVSRSVID